MQRLLKLDMHCSQSQEVAFFKKETNGYSLHFSNNFYTEDDQRQETWFCIHLKDDFFEQLKKLKRLPEPTTRAYYEEIEKNNLSQEIIDTLTKEVKEFKSTDTTVVLYQRKYEEGQARQEELSQTLRAEREKIESLESQNKQQQKKLAEDEQVIADKDAVIAQLQAKMREKDKKLAEQEQMQAESTGHMAMR